MGLVAWRRAAGVPLSVHSHIPNSVLRQPHKLQLRIAVASSSDSILEELVIVVHKLAGLSRLSFLFLAGVKYNWRQEYLRNKWHRKNVELGRECIRGERLSSF